MKIKEFLEKKEAKIAAIAIAVILVIIFVIMLFQHNTVNQTKDSPDECKENLSVMDEKALQALGTTDIPTEEGSATETGNGDTSNQGGNTNSDTNKKPTNNQDISTWVPIGDENVISPYMQMLIDAGYGNVVDWGNGSYGVLVHSDYMANGKYGLDILDEYLAARDLESVKSNAGIIDEDDDWYFYKVTEVRELITPDEDEFWD